MVSPSSEVQNQTVGEPVDVKVANHREWDGGYEEAGDAALDVEVLKASFVCKKCRIAVERIPVRSMQILSSADQSCGLAGVVEPSRERGAQ